MKEIKENRLIDIEKKISQFIPILENNFPRLLDFLKKEEKMGNYIEINMPFLESNLSFKFNLFYKKILISVMNHTDSEIFGHLIIEGYDCLDKEGISKLGDWKTHEGKSKRYTGF